jgi:hypothetical protein
VIPLITSLVALLKSYQLGGFVQRWIVMQIRMVALRLNQPAIVAAADEALPDVEAANRLRRAYELSHRKHEGSDLAHRLDKQIDTEVSAAHGRIQNLGKQGTELSSLARTLLDDAFPLGLKKHVGASHIEQSTHNAELLRVLEDKRFEAVVEYLRLDDIRSKLKELVPQFDAAIGVGETVTGAMLAAAELQGENAVMKLICDIVSAYNAKDPAQLKIRNALLAPFEDAKSTLRKEYALRAKGKKEAEACEDGSEEKKSDEGSAEKKSDEGSTAEKKTAEKSATQKTATETKVQEKATTEKKAPTEKGESKEKTASNEAKTNAASETRGEVQQDTPPTSDNAGTSGASQDEATDDGLSLPNEPTRREDLAMVVPDGSTDEQVPPLKMAR